MLLSTHAMHSKQSFWLKADIQWLESGRPILHGCLARSQTRRSCNINKPLRFSSSYSYPPGAYPHSDKHSLQLCAVARRGPAKPPQPLPPPLAVMQTMNTAIQRPLQLDNEELLKRASRQDKQMGTCNTHGCIMVVCILASTMVRSVAFIR